MSDRFNELMEQANARYTEAKALLTADDCSADDMSKADQLRAEAEGLKARASQLKKVEAGFAAAVPQQTEAPPPAYTFKDWEDYTRSIALAVRSQGKTVDPRLRYYEERLGDDHKDLSGTTGAGGGWLIPETQYREVMGVAAPSAIVRPRATRLPMSTRLVRISALDQTDTTAGTPHFFGGVDVAWVEEGGTIGERDAQFREIELIARELVGATTINNSLLKDAPALAAFLGSQRGFPGAITWQEEHAFLRGNGVGKPLGVVDAPCTKAVPRISGGNITFEDLANMEAAFMGEDPVWVASLSAKAELMTMKGPDSHPSYLWGNAVEGRPNTLVGHPILFTDKLPALGVRGDLVLADFSYYLVGTLEEGTTLEASPHQKFTSNKTVFRIMHRVDGKPWLNKVITIADGATEVSPFVVIAA